MNHNFGRYPILGSKSFKVFSFHWPEGLEKSNNISAKISQCTGCSARSQCDTASLMPRGCCGGQRRGRGGGGGHHMWGLTKIQLDVANNNNAAPGDGDLKGMPFID